MSEIPTVDVHPGGDVILICGGEDTEKRRLRVSSMILRHASSVFKAMLGPHFKEGNELATSSSVEIPLPDDDPYSMEAICYALHMLYDDAPSKLDALDLISVADHCDKYDIRVATRPAMNMWLEVCEVAEIDRSMSTLGQLMEIAFQLKLWTNVKKFGLMMVQEEGHTMSMHSMDLPKIPFYLFDQLEKLRLRTLYKMHSAIGREVDIALSYRNASGTCTGGCEGANSRKMHLLNQLRHRGLWPWDENKYRSLSDSCKGMDCKIVPNNGNVTKCGADCTVYTIESAQKFVRRLKFILRKILDQMVYECQFNSDEENGMILGFRWP